MALPDRFRQQCRWLRAAALLVFAGLALLLCIGAGSTPWLPGAGSEAWGGNHAVLLLVRLMPGIGYLWALWAVQRVLGELGNGRMFHAVVARAIRPVSYTHLDVYKRQPLVWCRRRSHRSRVGGRLEPPGQGYRCRFPVQSPAQT